MIRLGIIGCSDISTKSILPFASKNKEIQVVAVSSRNIEKAIAYKEKYGLEKAYGSYEEMMTSNLVDSVYIALPPAVQGEQVIKAIENGKNVLVEKPICLSTTEFNKIEKALSKSKVYLMEGLMVQHHPWQSEIKKIILENKFGALNKIVTNICMMMPDRMANGYRRIKDLGGGVFIDEGPYWLQFIQSCIGLRLDSFSTDIVSLDEALDMKTRIIAKANNIDIEFYCSYEDDYDATHIVYFDEATVYIKNFFRASLGFYKITIICETKEETYKVVLDPENYYNNQLNHFINMVKSRDRDTEKLLVESKERIKWMEKINQAINNYVEI